MRKFYLFLAGAFLALPLVAQNEPIRNPQTDPKVIYIQDFESDWDEWSTAIVDTINGIDYFKNGAYNPGSGIKIWENKAYQTGFIRRDTVINLYNGVMLSDNPDDYEGGVIVVKNGIVQPDGFKAKEDNYTIKTDAEDDITRKQALAVFGTDGGKKYFQYYAGENNGVKNQQSHVTPEYRRNLFIRLTPGAIEENSSYRVTMYLKTTKLENAEGKNETKATFRAELMRGYFSSEKNFSMGKDVSSSKSFYYSKDDFEDGEWTKITYMSYYLNKEIAEQFCYYNQYHDTWCDYWKWNKKGLKALSGYDSLYIIRQPDKFFLRVSFRGDSTIYDLDNVSITKSYIGGIQHADNMIRVDFGYQTNLKDQALAAKERTNIAAVEVPGQFFTVRGYKASTNKWTKIAINTAEYHDDGYMYMWAKPGAGGQPVKFANYDSVLVSFTNPSGVEYDTLALKYTSDLYPNALDEAWVNAGKRVFDFTNEVSTPNPNIKEGVFPLKTYPPVMRPNGAPYENGSFGLPGTLDSIRLVLSRQIEFDADETEGSGLKAFMRVYKDGVVKEIWPVSQSTDTWTTFKRQDKYKGTPLEGEYTFEVVQMKGVGDANYSKFEIKLNYEFGTFDKNLILTDIKSDWRSEIKEENAWARPVPESLWTWNNDDGFYQGTGSNFDPMKINGLYKTKDNEKFGNCYFYLTAYANKKLGKLYTVETLKKGHYSISFPAFGWARNNLTTTLYVYPKPAEMEYATLEAVANKTKIGEIKPTDTWSVSDNNNEADWDKDIKVGKIFELEFDVPADGEYVIEWQVTHNSGYTKYYGVAIGNYTISGPLSLASKYVSMVNVALQKAEAKKKEIDDATRKYKGADYNAFTAYITDVKTNIYAETAPSKYITATDKLEAGIKALQARMDTVDLFYSALDTVTKALAAKASYSAIEAYTKLNALKTQYANYDCSQYTSKQVSETADILNAGVDNLNKRIKYTTGYVALLDSTKKILDSTFVVFKDPKLEGKDLFEHDTLNQVYQLADSKKASLNSLSDEEFYKYSVGLENLLKDYIFAMDGVQVRTRQIRELFALADSLGYEFGGKKDSIKTLISELRKRDVELENVIREAVVLQILKKYAAGETVGFGTKDSKGKDSVDVSVLIPNYFLANEGEAGVNMENKNGVWAVKTISGGNKTAIPGWNFASIGGSNGYWLPTTVKVGAGDGHMDWEADGHAFIGGLRCGPQTSGTIELTDPVVIPEGFYFFGLEGYNQTSNVALELVSDSAKIGTDDKSSLNTVWNPKNGKFNYATVGKDSVKIGGKTSITIKQTSGSGSEFDMRRFFLILRGKLKGVDYAALARAQEAKLAEMITFVPEVKEAKPIAVQYYNLNGVQVLAPEAGKVVIKRTILSNGKSVAEKILVK